MAYTSPEDYPKIYGQHFAHRNQIPVVVIGRTRYNKYDLGLIGCPHIQAAREVDRALRTLKAEHHLAADAGLGEVAKRLSPEDFVGLKGFGVTAFYALTCLLRDANVRLGDFYKSKVTVNSLQDQVRKQRRKRGRRAA